MGLLTNKGREKFLHKRPRRRRQQPWNWILGPASHAPFKNAHKLWELKCISKKNFNWKALLLPLPQFQEGKAPKYEFWGKILPSHCYPWWSTQSTVLGPVCAERELKSIIDRRSCACGWFIGSFPAPLNNTENWVLYRASFRIRVGCATIYNCLIKFANS